MLGEILPDLVLLAVAVVFLVRRGAKSTATAAARRSLRIAGSSGAPRSRARASAMAPLAALSTCVASAPRAMNAVEHGVAAPPSPRKALAPWRYRLHPGRGGKARRRTQERLRGEAADVLGLLHGSGEVNRHPGFEPPCLQARVNATLPALWLLVLRASRKTHEVQRWPSLATLTRTSRLDRRSVVRIVRELEASGLVEARPGYITTRKAGAA
jgi:hypothetical protein